MDTYNRRQFIKFGAGASVALLSSHILPLGCGAGGGTKADVYALLETDLGRLYDLGREAARTLGITRSALTGSTVYVKPNFVALGMELFGIGFNPVTGECTKAELVAGIAEQCLEAGAAEVIIGEGAQAPSWDWSTLAFLEGAEAGGATNLQAAVDRLKGIYGDGRIRLLCVNEADDWALIPSSIDEESVRDGIHVCRSWAEADHVISVPVIKTHQWANLTASMKNLFGLTSITRHGNGISRCGLHSAYAKAACHGEEEAGVSGAFIDMVKWRVEQGFQDFAVIDGTICLEGDGPHMAPVNDGRTVHMRDRNAAGCYFLLASDDLVAADVLVSRIVNIPQRDIISLRMAEYLSLGNTGEILLEGASLEELMVPDWKRPTLRSEAYFTAVCAFGGNKEG